MAQSPLPDVTRVRIHPLPLRYTLRVKRPVDIWYKPGISVAVAAAIPQLILLAMGRLELAAFTSSGALSALYAHGLPYRARAATMFWVCVSMILGADIGLTAASLTNSAVVLILVVSVLAAVQKLVCEAVRIGPPGNVVFTFVSAGFAFFTESFATLPFHLLLVALGAVCAWAVTMAPALVRPRGPQRIAVARAMEAGARHLTARPGDLSRTRRDAASAVNDAWHTLFLVPAANPAKEASRAHLERLLVHAESALARTPNDPATAGAEARARKLLDLADALRRNRPLPAVRSTPDERDELAGVAAEYAGLRHPAPGTPLRGRRALRALLRPDSPLLPIGVRLLIGATLAGWTSLSLGVGHPYWAVVTAASVFQANVNLSWTRALQRTLGNFVGLICFTALLPLTRSSDIGLLAVMWLCLFGAEALVSRNYWLGTVFVTQQALLITEFAGHQPALPMVGDRWIDTVIGAALGVTVALAVGNWRAGGRLEAALRRTSGARAEAERVLRTLPSPPLSHAALSEAFSARDRLIGALVELRAATDVASGEWWQRALPSERIAVAEQTGHRVLAVLIQRLTTAPFETDAEDPRMTDAADAPGDGGEEARRWMTASRR